MERLTERTADGILVKENYEKETLKTLYSCYGENRDWKGGGVNGKEQSQ